MPCPLPPWPPAPRFPPRCRCVIHYQLPASVDVYVHRSGRTARAEAEGIAIALVTPKENARFLALLKAMKRGEPPEFPLVSGVRRTERGSGAAAPAGVRLPAVGGAGRSWDVAPAAAAAAAAGSAATDQHASLPPLPPLLP